MRDRPIAGVLAAIAAAMFVAAFAAAAVTRPETAAVAQDTRSERARPRHRGDEDGGDRHAVALQRGGAPRATLPAHRKPAKKKAKARVKVTVSTPPPAATPVPTATAPRVSTPPVRNTPAADAQGAEQDL